MANEVLGHSDPVLFFCALSLSLSPEKKRLLREFGSCREWRHVTMSPSVDTYYVVVTLKDIFFYIEKKPRTRRLVPRLQSCRSFHEPDRDSD